jgi:hypothetical protein
MGADLLSADVSSDTTPTMTFRPIDVIGCVAAIAAVKTSLAYRGFARTVARIRTRTRYATEGADASDDLVARLDRLVAIGAAWYPGRALCLERSLVLYERLRRAGARAELRLGVQAVPFASHAWIEWHGAPLNDVLEHTEQFTPIALDTP